MRETETSKNPIINFQFIPCAEQNHPYEISTERVYKGKLEDYFAVLDKVFLV